VGGVFYSVVANRRQPSMGKGAISWFSRIQMLTAAALSEAEYVALSEVVN